MASKKQNSIKNSWWGCVIWCSAVYDINSIKYAFSCSLVFKRWNNMVLVCCQSVQQLKKQRLTLILSCRRAGRPLWTFSNRCSFLLFDFLSCFLGEVVWNYTGLCLPLSVINSNRCIKQAIKTSLVQEGVIDIPPSHSQPPWTLPAGDHPAFHTFLGSETNTQAVSSHTYWGAVTCATFDQERSTGKQGLLVVGAPPPHRHLAPVESGLCSPFLSLSPRKRDPSSQGGSCLHGVFVVSIADYIYIFFSYYKLRGTWEVLTEAARWQLSKPKLRTATPTRSTMKKHTWPRRTTGTGTCCWILPGRSSRGR